MLVVWLLILVVAAGRVPAADSAPDSSSTILPVPLPVRQSEVVAPGVDLTDQGVRGMALDPDGRPHVVYGRNHLFHAWYDGASWQIETVVAAGGSESGPVIAIEHAVAIPSAGSTSMRCCRLYLFWAIDRTP